MYGMWSAVDGSKLSTVIINIDPKIKQIHWIPIFSVETGDKPKLIKQAITVTEMNQIQ